MISEEVKRKAGTAVFVQRDIPACPRCRSHASIETKVSVSKDTTVTKYRIVCRQCGVCFDEWFDSVSEAKGSWREFVRVHGRLKRSVGQLRDMGVSDETMQRMLNMVGGRP